MHCHHWNNVYHISGIHGDYDESNSSLYFLKNESQNGLLLLMVSSQGKKELRYNKTRPLNEVTNLHGLTLAAFSTARKNHTAFLFQRDEQSKGTFATTRMSYVLHTYNSKTKTGVGSGVFGYIEFQKRLWIQLERIIYR